jgi:hypothetical protein
VAVSQQENRADRDRHGDGNEPGVCQPPGEMGDWAGSAITANLPSRCRQEFAFE